VRCPACGAENATGARFCASCGNAFEAVCSNCGEPLPEGARFCSACGQPVAETPSGEERKLVTVLFADVTGSTGLGERLDPEHLREVMAAYFEAMRDEIEAQGGTVEKFIGDAVMAVFGVPAAHEDDPARALRAALRMRDRLAVLNTDLAERHGLTLEMRIGVNTGDVLAVAEPRPGEGMVSGDPVNVAARLEQTAEPGQVLVGERAARATRGFTFEEVESLALRGKGRPVRAFRLQGEEPGPERGVPGLRAPMIGRGSELALLVSLFERVAAEARPHLVTVYGPAGVGKSRLTAEFLARAERSPFSSEFLRGRCLPYGQGVTYWPLGEILKSLAGILDTDPADLTLEKVHKLGVDLLTSDVTGDAKRAAAALAYTVGVEDPAFPFRELPPRQVQLEIHGAWRSFFSALSRDGPAVVVVEDIHWADAALLDLLEELAERVQGATLFVCPARPELTERRPTWGGGRRNFSSIFLEPLSREESDHLVRFLLEVEHLPDTVRERILERAEGNPFFLEEIVRQLIDERRIVRVNDRWQAAGDIEDVTIPDTVQGVLAARIDLLSPEAKQALQMAAVVGRVFWAGAVRALVEDPVELDEVLAGLEDRELVSARLSSSMAGDPEYIFKHVLTRDVAYESLRRRDRSRAHARVAAWIEETAGARQKEFLELLAHHCTEAHRAAEHAGGTEGLEELRARAFRFLRLAADDARSKLALAKAQQLAEQALFLAGDPLERAQALESLGEAYLYDYEGDLAWKVLSEAVDLRLVAAPEDGLSIARLCARALETPVRNSGLMHSLPHREQTARLLEVGLSSVPAGDSEEFVRLLTMKSFWPWAMALSREERPAEPEMEEAKEAGERAAEMALRLGRADLASAALDGAGSYYLERGQYGPMMRLIERRLELAPRVEDPWELQDIFNMAAWTAFHIGRYREAVRYADEGFERWVADVPAMAMHCLPWRALGRFRLGEWTAFLEDVSRTEELLGDRREHPQPFFARHFAAAALVHDVQGDSHGADRILEMLRRLEREIGHPPALSAPWMAILLARRGDVDGAWFYLREEEPYGGRGVLLEASCDVVAELAAWAEAPRLVHESREHARVAGLLALLCFADRLEGRAAAAAGDARTATDLLRKATEGFSRLEARWEWACTELALAEVLAEQGDAKEASSRLEDAAEVFDDLPAVRERSLAANLMARLG
jgi:class 3 adenylate cyclase/tetratricopeptide (TPR) repeat protein